MKKSEAKQEYNILLQRYYKAEEFFNDKKIPYRQKEKQLENFREVLRGLNYHLEIIGKYTKKEMLEGFK